MFTCRVASAIALVVAAPASRAQCPITRVSVDSAGGQTQGGYEAAISADGDVVAFTSAADDLVPGDTNGTYDVFVHRRSTGVTTRVSVDSNGAEADSGSGGVSISADGNVVVFISSATNLAQGDASSDSDVFAHDLVAATTTLVSIDTLGTAGDGFSFSAEVSADGRFVAFASVADDLVPGDLNATADIFVRDRAAGVTTRVSVDSAGVEADLWSDSPSISADGQLVSFVSAATNLVPGDANQTLDVFVHDRASGQTTRASLDSTGGEADSASWGSVLSADGRFVAFTSWATNLVPADTNAIRDVFLHELATGATTRVSVDSNGAQLVEWSDSPSITSDGGIVAFISYTTYPCGGYYGYCTQSADVFVHDRSTGQSSQVTVNCLGVGADDNCFAPSLSADGQIVALWGYATNLVGGDTNGASDVFVCDRSLGGVDATWSYYGSGFQGWNGVPTQTPWADPMLGQNLTIDITNSASTPTLGFVLAGTSQTSIGTGLGGTLLVGDLFLVLPLSLGSAGVLLSADLPADVALCGFSVYTQVLELDTGAARGVSFTSGLELVLGS